MTKLEVENAPDPLVPDRLYRKQETATLEGIGMTSLHHRICRGEYEVVTDGTSQPKITGRSILRRREQHLRPATYGLRAGIRGVPSKAEPTEQQRHQRRQAATRSAAEAQRRPPGPARETALSSRGPAGLRTPPR